MNFKEHSEGSMGGFGGRKQKGEMLWLNYNLKKYENHIVSINWSEWLLFFRIFIPCHLFWGCCACVHKEENFKKKKNIVLLVLGHKVP